MASSDFVEMQDALRTNNVTAAQQAYERLQSDLVLGNTQGTTTTATEHYLDIVA